MLSNPEQFALAERIAHEDGRWERFEKEYGKVLGRMMIELCEVPEGIEVRKGKHIHAFRASFDFYDMEIGVALDVVSKQAASGIWMTPQTKDAEEPTQEWVEFFLEKLIAGIDEDGCFGTPIYSFVNDSSDMTIIPVRPD